MNSENAMKITSEQLRALQENEVRKAKPHHPSGEFSELFTRQLDAGQSTGVVIPENAPATLQGAAAIPFGGIPDASGSSSHSAREQAAFLMDGMFTTAEQYAEQLARGASPDLKGAYGLLQNLNGQIEGFRKQYPDAGETMPELASLLNEIDVLATTETFKMNRGDYL